MGNEFDDLKQLAEMLEKGEVTKAEYESIKADLLADMDSSEPARTESIQTSTNQETEAVTENGAMDDQIRWWLVGSGALMAIGSFMPWVQAGIISASGTDGDGMFTLIFGVVIALIGVAKKATLITGWATVALAFFSLLIIAIVIGNFETVEVFDTTIGSLGTGLFVVGLASLVALIAGFKVIGAARKAVG